MSMDKAMSMDTTDQCETSLADSLAKTAVHSRYEYNYLGGGNNSKIFGNIGVISKGSVKRLPQKHGQIDR